VTVDGAIYGPPLWSPISPSMEAKRNVIVVTTQHDSVYAFDADSNAILARRSGRLFVDSNHGGTGNETSVPSSGDCSGRQRICDINPEVGVTGTPVVDPSTNILYCEQVRQRVEHSFSSACMLWTLHERNEKLNGNRPVVNLRYGCGHRRWLVRRTIGVRRRRRTPASRACVGKWPMYMAWASHEDSQPVSRLGDRLQRGKLAFAGGLQSTPTEASANLDEWRGSGFRQQRKLLFLPPGMALHRHRRVWRFDRNWALPAGSIQCWISSHRSTKPL